MILLSRPRFWLYTAGPFLLGALIADSSAYTSVLFWLLFFFWLFPMNLLLYGVNDFFDWDTDRFSAKKAGRELVGSRSFSWVWMTLLGVLVAFVSHWWLFVYVFLAIGYSAPPLRFKARAFVDSLSNVLYIVPGLFGFAFFGGDSLNWFLVLAACFWAISMHLFSAIPDIVADSRASLRTTAIVLGKKGSLIVCSALWFLASLFSFWAFLYYALIPLFLLSSSLEKIGRMYWYFPLINTVTGFILFLLVLL